VDFDFNSMAPSGFRDDTWILNTEVCWGSSGLGADFDLTQGVPADDRVLFNFKFVFLEKERISAAAGIWGITSAERLPLSW